MAAATGRLGGTVQGRAPQPVITAVSWQPECVLDLAGWIHQGKRLGSIGRGSSWWIGDWVNYGNAKFGEKYSRAAQVTSYDIQTLMNMAYVASRFEISRRRENLSWSHHAEVAALPPAEQDRWLEYAGANRVSVSGLREQLRAWRARRDSVDGDAGAADGGSVEGACPDRALASWEDDTVVCPQCGYELERRDARGGALGRGH